MRLPNPLVPGFNPDPSVVRVDGEAGPDYHLVTSTFEYLPGLPVYHSTDLVDWELVGHVVTRPEQFDPSDVSTGMGLWAPTIRWHGGAFHVIVAAAGIGTRIYTASDPAGPWSDGTAIAGLRGIDPDLAWDDDGTCYVTFSGLALSGPDAGRHLGIQQVRVDAGTGEMLEEPRSLWSGTGGMFPEAPHLHRIGGWWYLTIAEGGTERGHAVTIARAERPDGPFEGCPHNPILTARGTDRPIQNTGHGDLVLAPDGSWSMVLLGMRTRGLTRAFSALGRETFGTHVAWVDGWPIVDPVELTDGRGAARFGDDFRGDALGPEWIGVRRQPATVGRVAGGALHLTGEGRTMSHPCPTFVGRRQRILDARISTVISAGEGEGEGPGGGAVGGLAVRYDEANHYEIEYTAVDGRARVTARACLPTIDREIEVEVPAGDVELVLEMHPVPTDFPELGRDPGALTAMASCDTIHLVAIDAGGVRHDLAAIDGRYLSAESACSFTGRVAGLYATSGQVSFRHYREERLA